MNDDDKMLVYVETRKKEEFYRAVDNCCSRANILIETFEAFQDWLRVTSESQFTELCRDPRKYFDKALTDNIHLSAGKAFNPSVAAQLFNIPRDEFFNMLDGIQVLDDQCIPCKKVAKVQKKGQRALYLTEYQPYKNFLTFTNGKFTVNETAIAEHVATFDVFADSVEQVDTLTHFKDLVVILNIHAKKFGFNTSDKQLVAKALHLYLERAIEGNFITDADYIKNLILTLKYNKV